MHQDKNIVSFRPKIVSETSAEDTVLFLGFPQRHTFDMTVTRHVGSDGVCAYTFTVPTNSIMDQYILSSSGENVLWTSVSRCGQFGVCLDTKSIEIVDLKLGGTITQRYLTRKEQDIVFTSLTRDAEDPVVSTTFITDIGRMCLTYPKAMLFDDTEEHMLYREYLYVSFAWRNTRTDEDIVADFPILPSIGSVTIEEHSVNAAIAQLQSQLVFIQ